MLYVHALIVKEVLELVCGSNNDVSDDCRLFVETCEKLKHISIKRRLEKKFDCTEKISKDLQKAKDLDTRISEYLYKVVSFIQQ